MKLADRSYRTRSVPDHSPQPMVAMRTSCRCPFVTSCHMCQSVSRMGLACGSSSLQTAVGAAIEAAAFCWGRPLRFESQARKPQNRSKSNCWEIPFAAPNPNSQNFPNRSSLPGVAARAVVFGITQARQGQDPRLVPKPLTAATSGFPPGRC